MSVTPVKKSSTLYDAANPVRSVFMTFDEFAAIERNPHQRNEEDRIRKPHLRVFSPAHRSVSAAVLPNGSVFKLDGHTRVAAGIVGLMPELVKQGFNVTLFSVKTMEEVVALYHTFDNSKAAKSAPDNVSGAMAYYGVETSTPWVKSGVIGSGLTMAHTPWLRFQGRSTSKITYQDRVCDFQDEIVLFDQVSPKKGLFPMGVLAGCLLALKKHAEIALPFIMAYNDGLGKTMGQDRDAVRMLHEYLNEQRLNCKMAGAKNNDPHMKMTLALFKRSLGHVEFYTRHPAPLSPIEFLR